MNPLTRNQKISIIFGILSIIATLIGGGIYFNGISIKNSNLNQSPLCTGENCYQNINYNQVIQEEKRIYVSPEKKLIRANLSDYSFPLKIINERREDYNNIGLLVYVPVEFGVYRVMIEPMDKSEVINKYNNSLQIMMPCYGEPIGEDYVGVCFIESVYSTETKDYKVTLNTRDYPNDFYIKFGLTRLDGNLTNIFRSFGVE
jgi:hypothetical protein